MFWLSGGFLFKRVASPFHALDARVRLLISLELLLLSLLVLTVVQLGLVILTILIIGVAARSLVRIGRTIAFSGLFGVFIFVVNLLFGLGLFHAILYSVRFLAIIGSTSVFFVTTSPDELEQIMKWMRVPRDVVFAFVTAVRFIPVVMLDAFQIMDAQKSRGLELERGGLLKRVRNMVPILIPLVVNSVVRSGELAEAMESRAYGSTPSPTSLYAMRASRRDLGVAAASLVAFSVATLYIYHLV